MLDLQWDRRTGGLRTDKPVLATQAPPLLRAPAAIAVAEGTPAAAEADEVAAEPCDSPLTDPAGAACEAAAAAVASSQLPGSQQPSSSRQPSKQFAAGQVPPGSQQPGSQPGSQPAAEATLPGVAATATQPLDVVPVPSLTQPVDNAPGSQPQQGTQHESLTQCTANQEHVTVPFPGSQAPAGSQPQHGSPQSPLAQPGATQASEALASQSTAALADTQSLQAMPSGNCTSWQEWLLSEAYLLAL